MPENKIRTRKIHQQVCFIRKNNLRGMWGHVPTDNVDQAGWNKGTRLAMCEPLGIWNKILQALPQFERTGSASSHFELYSIGIS